MKISWNFFAGKKKPCRPASTQPRFDWKPDPRRPPSNQIQIGWPITSLEFHIDHIRFFVQHGCETMWLMMLKFSISTPYAEWIILQKTLFLWNHSAFRCEAWCWWSTFKERIKVIFLKPFNLSILYFAVMIHCACCINLTLKWCHPSRGLTATFVSRKTLNKLYFRNCYSDRCKTLQLWSTALVPCNATCFMLIC